MEKVRLPSDNLTPGQLKQRNGELEVYCLGRPMKWPELLTLPADLRRKYLERLRDEYRANQVMVADMLGVSIHTFRKKCTAWGIKFLPCGGHGNEKIRQAWAEFLGVKYVPSGSEASAENPDPAPVPCPGPKDPAPSSGSMVFQGPAGAALRQVYKVLGETPCHITITWEVEDDHG